MSDPAATPLSPRHPLWRVGFRPFFLLACLSGLLLPSLWLLFLRGKLVLPTFPAGLGTHPFFWHAHEMFFGFGLALLGGFLLTASKNWVNQRGYHGLALQLLVAGWLLARWAMSGGGSGGISASDWPAPLWLAAVFAYPLLLVALLWRTLWQHRAQDSFRADNRYFLLLLPLLPVAEALLLSADEFNAGVSMSLALFRLAFLLMLERTLQPFMQGAFQVRLWRQPRFDEVVRLLGAALIFTPWLPAAVSSLLAAALGGLLLYRLARWQPQLACRRLELAVMYLGLLCMALHLLLEAAAPWLALPQVGSAATHLFTLGLLGLIGPAMMVRISKGHTGRKVGFDRGDKAVLWLMLAALLARVVLPQLLPALYARWLDIAATGWLLGFGILLLRYAPYLWQARIDGKEH